MYYGGKRIFLPLRASQAGIFSNLSAGDTGALPTAASEKSSCPQLLLSYYERIESVVSKLLFLGLQPIDITPLFFKATNFG